MFEFIKNIFRDPKGESLNYRLTVSEQIEYEYLKNKPKEFGEGNTSRHDQLIMKRWHNCCLNPDCGGFVKNEEEEICPKCSKRVLKLV